MKSLVIKTILVISAVALTGALAWSQEINPNDVNLAQGINKPKEQTEGGRCPECERRAEEAALQKKTNAAARAARQEGVSPADVEDGTK